MAFNTNFVLLKPINLKTNTVIRTIFIYQEQPVIAARLFKIGIDNGQNLRLCLDIRSHLFSFYS